MSPQAQIAIAVAVTVFVVLLGVAFFAFIVRRVSRRRFGGRGIGQLLPKAESPGCGGNCGCNCAPPPRQGCIPSLDCNPPYAHPIAIHGLSCNPSDDHFTFAGDVQTFVDASNRQKEIQRQAESIERLEQAVQWMKNGSASAPSRPKASK